MKEIIFFTGDGCASCAALKPKFEELCRKQGFTNYKYVNIYEREDADELAARYGFRGLPTIVYKDGESFHTETGNTALNYFSKFFG